MNSYELLSEVLKEIFDNLNNKLDRIASDVNSLYEKLEIIDEKIDVLGSEE